MKRKKVYILGDARGVYRIQNVIKFLADRPKEYGFIFDNRMSGKRPWKYLKSLFCDPVRVACSDIVYVCILNVDVDILYAMLWARLLRKKILVDYYVSIYEKVVIDEGWFKPRSVLGRLAKKLDRFYYNSGKRVIFLNECERDHYCELANIKRKPDKEAIISLCVEESFKIQGNRSDRFNICWWGSYLPLHGLKYILQAAKIVKDRGLPINWYFFGNSDEKGAPYVLLAREYGIDDICNFENSYTMKNGKLQEFLKTNCNLALGNFGDSPKAKFLMNNKVIDACAMKAPILTGNATVYSVYFDGENDIYMSPNDPQRMADRIEEIYNEQKEILDKRVERNYQIYQDNFTVKLYTLRLEKLFGEL